MKRTNSPDDIYPLTIVATRYSGLYEGGMYAAFKCYPHDIPKAAYDGSDNECAEWWEEDHEVGVGDTPEDAQAELAAVLFSHEGGGGVDDE